ncbi:Putative Acyl transferase domain superfamily, GroES-like superfamily, alcohol dehydrogenase [Colletotrichum destructivum]|uniref:Acyl transferase domain superfamily, GroES-like superfamily, alcohol dehydrogenase n=1 Tax=Colletotrichum destructivum TaxID=34406 RepID=A0AAX4IXT5_9PEZI|nr:Putative Acyl transferase domain superfamily, GroES-like superfamily, alcohol dehydrogenase [Colletotrichum destructivum]
MEPLAIIGLSVKFPQDATSPEEFWEMLREGRSAASKVPEDRFNVDAFYHPDPNRLDSLRVRDAHFMKEDPRAFDAPFFNMSPAEASVLDPQQRGLLEGAYHCLENAGISIPNITGSNTSVFVACFGRDYDAFIARDVESMSRYHATGSGSSMLANRISHAFDLRGPSITVDTACSAGLSAFHLACQSVRSGESDLSLVCGGNTYLTPESLTIPLDDAGFLSPDGRCYSFDHKANGYARGEGFGCVAVKKLSHAIRDGNVIRAVVRATGVNQDGKTPSITQPSLEAQIALIRKTYEQAGLGFSTTEYVEAHGTGTAVGDPIEARAIGEVFRKSRRTPLHIGSVKSNIGHLEGASGLAGIIKTVLVLENGIIPPICNFEKVNPAISEEELRLSFPTNAVSWPNAGLRRASVSSFGYGGSNGHVILEDAGNYLRIHGLQGHHKSVDMSSSRLPVASTNSSLDTPRSSASSSADVSRLSGSNLGLIRSFSSRLENLDLGTRTETIGIIPLSSADEDGPSRLATTLSSHFKDVKHDLLDILHTLSRHRTHLPWRSFVVMNSSDDLETLADFTSPAVRASHNNPVLHFVFTGQGAAWPRMGLDLLRYESFKESVVDADNYLSSKLGNQWSVLTELSKSLAEASRISSPALAQPLCTIMQVALVDLLRSWGVQAAGVCGHSSGEIAAAYCAGALTREEAWRIAFFRGLVSEKLAASPDSTGNMMSAGLSEQEAKVMITEEGLEDHVEIACVNSPVNVTLSGTTGGLDKLWDRLDCDKKFVRRLNVGVAYHSKQMLQVSNEYLALLQDMPIKGQAETTRGGGPTMFSSVTGSQIASLHELRNPAYWVSNLTGTVRFSDALAADVQHFNLQSRRGLQVLLEIGPQGALRRPVQDTLTPLLGGKDRWFYTTLLDPKLDDTVATLGGIARLWCTGLDVDLSKTVSSPKSEEEIPEQLVDLPAYPFNHSKLYWEESRLSERFAHRQHRRHALLGLRARDWNSNEASWRHIIRYDENPWILDHAINGSAVYPGSGMIVMAVEGARQMTSPEFQIKNYRVVKTRFLRAVSVDTSERGVEAQLHMRPRKDINNSTLSKWYDWRVFTEGSGHEWLEAAHGSIQVEYDDSGIPGAISREQRQHATIKRQYNEIVDACRFKTYPDQMYGNMRQLGLGYGPFFARLHDIVYDRDGHAAASLKLRDYAERMVYAEEDPCVIHPTTLDALCHLQMAALSAGGLRPIPTMMFTHCQEMWISNKLFDLPGNPLMHAASTQTMRGFRESEFDTVAVLDGTNEPVVVIRGERGTAITSLDDAGETQEADAACYSLDFRADLSLMASSTTTHNYLMNHTFRRFELPDKDLMDRADALSIFYVEQVLDQLEAEGMPQYGDYRDLYIKWMQRARSQREKYVPASRGRHDLDGKALAASPEPTEPTTRLVHKVGENLYDILTGKANVMEVLFENRLVDDYYSAEMFKIHAHRVGAYIEILAHANPYLKILEIGAGTGSSAAGVLPYLVYDQGSGRELKRLSEYVYTDVSTGFFENARERFAKYSSVMTFKKLDVEQDPVSQGFEEGRYDIVIAGNVLHATSDMHQSLRAARSLLKPGGKLIMVEICNPESIREGLIFGLLPGWWLRTERGTTCVYPNQGPLLTEAQWNEVMIDCGFSGVDMQWRDHEELPYHRLTTIVATAVEPAPDVFPSSRPTPMCFVVYDETSCLQRNLCQALEDDVLGSGSSTATVSALSPSQAATTDVTGATVVCLLELDKSVLRKVDETQIEVIKSLALRAKSLLWVTTGGGPDTLNPDAELSTGFGRTICSERGEQGVLIASLASESVKNPRRGSALLAKILSKVQEQQEGDNDGWHESELAEYHGVWHIPRVVPNGSLNDSVARRILKPGPQPCFIGPEADRRIRLSINNPGLLDTLRFKEIPDAEKPLTEDEVEIQVMSSSINFKDVMIALGQIPGNGFGYDGAGIISRVGPKCQHTKVGDRVMFVSVTGAFSTFVRVSELQTHPMPDTMPFTVAASIPVVYCTALYSIDYVARLRPGESILIHAGAGGVGQAAVMIAKQRGATIYVTAGSQTKRDLLVNEYGIPPENIFSSRDASFYDDIMCATNGRGVDVVLNSLGGELLQQSWRCIKVFGRFVEIGKADILQDTGLSMASFDRNVTFSAVDLIVVVENSRELMKQVMTDVMALWTEHPEDVHEPRPLHVYSATQFEEAMRYLQSGRNTGKTVIDWSQPAQIEFLPALKPSYQFHSDATYVLAGGLGGLPKAIVRWMIGRGARYFLLLSRSGAHGNSDAQKFMDEVESHGARVLAPACDISNRQTLEAILLQTPRDFPPIRGCIQGAMVLHDELLENMTASVWNEPLESKYWGSRNLGEILPPDLDFYIMLSSFAGVMGNRGQSNYAAGNTYQDGLARHLVSQRRQRAVSVNLGLILETGSANSNYFFVQSTLRAGFSGVTQDQLLGLLDALCDPSYDNSSPSFAQVVHIADSPKTLWEKGHESVLGWMTKPLFRNLHRLGAQYEAEEGKVGGSSGTEVDYLAEVKSAESADLAGDIIAKALITKLAKSLSLNETDLDPSMPVFKMGVDSLIAVEVRYWFLKTFGAQVAVFSILKDQSMNDLCLSVAMDIKK